MFDKEKLRDIKNKVQQWQESHLQDFEKERRGHFACRSGIPVKRCYTPLDLAEKGFAYLQDVGLPGGFPFVRGVTPTMYRGRLWETKSYSGRAAPEDSNKLWKALIAGGLGRIFMALDLPTQLGLDPDHPMAEGEVGRVGLSMRGRKQANEDLPRRSQGRGAEDSGGAGAAAQAR